MNYTDKFFEFPVRIYDGFDLRKAIEKEDKAFELDADIAEPIESAWAVGVAAVLPENILGYSETFSKGKDTEAVEKDGFDLLLVETKLQGDMICTWNRKRFKKELNEFIEKYEAAMNEELKTRSNWNYPNTGVIAVMDVSKSL